MVLFQYPPQSIQVSSGPLAIEVDGVITNVSIDTAVPANTVPVPVSIYSSSGPINVTAGDLNVHLSDVGVNFDRTRIGDGTNQWGINASTEGLVHDADLLTELSLKANLTDTQPVSIAATVAVSGPLTDTQLRASAVPVSMAAAPLPSGAATETTLAAVLADTATIDSNIASLAGEDFATQTTLSAISAQLPATLGGLKTNANSLAVCMSLEQQTIIQDTLNSLDLLRTNTGPTNETAPATDTATSGLNGRLQRIAQRITSLIGLFPSSIGTKNSAGSLSVVLASDQAVVPTSQVAPSAVTVKQAAITVGTSAVRLTTDGSAPSSTRQKLIFQPLSTSTGNFYYGSSSVTSSGATRGVQIFPGANEVFVNDANDYYIISDTAAQTLLITEAE